MNKSFNKYQLIIHQILTLRTTRDKIIDEKLQYDVNRDLPDRQRCSDVSFRSHIGRDVTDRAETSSRLVRD